MSKLSTGMISGSILAPLLVVMLILALGAVPMGRILYAALAPAGALDPAGFLARLGKASALRATWHTLDTATFGAAIALVLGASFAVLVAMTDLPGRKPFGFLVLLPLMIAP
ncbi:MAG: iron ABC transporter permease, partial [Hyphomicrobiales bacterium]